MIRFTHLLLVISLVIIGGCSHNNSNTKVPRQKNDLGISKDYYFNGSISEEVLDNYLSRAITQGELCQIKDDDIFYENIRMLRNIGAKFIGRAAFVWTPLRPEEEHFKIVKKRARQAHQIDPGFMLQCCLFEAVFHSSNELSQYGLDQISIPEYVFKEFNLPVEKRNFDYYAMLYDDDKLTDKEHLYHNHWVKGGSVPDLASIETQMYFFYRATRYIDMGFESIHMGQIQLMNDNDPENRICFELFDRIRKYAKKNARRNFVLFDAHTPPPEFGSSNPHGIINEKNELLFDFHSFPLRPKEICSQPYHTVLKVGFHDAIYQNSMGGITPSNWKCDSLPYLVEMDNSGASNPGVCGGQEWWWPWGWDEISWFAHCSKEYRNDWLRYAHKWINDNAPAGHLQMPGSTTIASDPIGDIFTYRANMKSDECPNGFGQEKTIKEIWKNEQSGKYNN
jgi:hypothetical protein